MNRISFLCAPALAWAISCPLASSADVLLAGPPPLPRAPVGAAAHPKPASGAEAAEEEPGAAESAGILRFFNGDTLHGELQMVDGMRTVRWNHQEARTVIEFSPTNISSIELKSPANAPPRRRGNCLVRLTNQDELLADLTSLDRDGLVVETWYAGQLKIPRPMVQSILPLLSRPNSIYEGPTGLKGWQMVVSDNDSGQQKGWRFAKGAFLAERPCSAGRDVKLPKLANIEFDLAWRGSLEFGIAFYIDSFKQEPCDGYALQLNEATAALQSMRKDGNSTQLGNAEIPELATKSKSHFSIRINQEQKSISLLHEDMLVKQWKERGEFVGKGTGLAFIQEGQGLVKLSNIRVSDWDGKFDDQPAPPAPGKEDLVKLANNDKVSGSLESIKDNKLSFVTPFATLDVPLQRVSRIDLAGESARHATNGPGAVRVEFAERGWVTFELERWDERQALGTSPNFGKMKFDPSAFVMIQFNLERRRNEAEPWELDEEN